MSLLNRRQLLTAAAAAAPNFLPLRATLGQTPASDRITVGVIGLGSRGFNLIDEFLGQGDAQIVAICDVDRLHYRDRPWGIGPAMGREPAAAHIRKAAQQRNAGPAVYSDHHQLIAHRGLDAVVVATPDHWHAVCTLDALRAGKDVYCEKPITHTFAEGQQVYRTAQTRKAVFQTGSQQRSDAKFRRAVELARGGHLGELRQVQVGLPPGYEKPQGDTTVSDPPASLDYNRWCGPAPQLPYMRARHHRWWRGHRAYGGGVLMDWIGHHNDIAHWALDTVGPRRVEIVEWTQPGTEVYNTPHHYTLRCQYEGGIESTISSRNPQGLKLIGSEGWVFVRRGQIEASQPHWIEPEFKPGEDLVYRSDHHVRNFLDCVRSRKPCIAAAETAHRSITPGHLGYVAQQLSRALDWDPQSERVVGDEEANRLLQTIDYRQPWTL